MSHTKAYLRERYRPVTVDDPKFTRGARGRSTVGRGLFANAKLAYDTQQDRHVIIKCQRNLPCAVSEAAIHAGVHSEYAIQLLDTARSRRHHYMVLERGEPIDLHAVSEARAMELMRQLAAALQDLRAQGIYHGDIAVRNMYLVRGRLKLGDFCLAVVRPSRLLQPLYACIEALQFCATCVALLKCAGSPRAREFARWSANLPTLDMTAVQSCPWFNGQPDADLKAVTARAVPGVHAIRRCFAALAMGVLPLRLGPPDMKRT